MRPKLRMSRLSATLLIALLAVGVAFGAFMLRRDISTTLRIKAMPSMKLFDVDGVTELTSIGMGDLLWNSGKMFPGGAYEVPSVFYFVNNTDQVDLYVSLSAANYPAADMTYQLFIRRGDKPAFTQCPLDAIYEFPILSPALHPGDKPAQFAWFYILVWVNSPAFGDYAPVLSVNGYDTPTG